MAFAQVVEEGECDGTGEFFLFLVRAGFPGRVAGGYVGRFLFAVVRSAAHARREVHGASWLCDIGVNKVGDDHVFCSRGRCARQRIGKTFGLRAARAVDVDHGGREDPIGEREAGAAGEHFAAGGDECAAVKNGSTRFVAEQIGISVTHAKCSRALEHEAFANLLLGEREVAGAGIEQHIGATPGELSTCAVGDPGVAADFETDPHTAAIEEQVAEQDFFAANIDATHDAGRPTAEPARLVVDAVASEVLFADEAQ